MCVYESVCVYSVKRINSLCSESKQNKFFFLLFWIHLWSSWKIKLLLIYFVNKKAFLVFILFILDMYISLNCSLCDVNFNVLL
jgi:hypothetical protein